MNRIGLLISLSLVLSVTTTEAIAGRKNAKRAAKSESAAAVEKDEMPPEAFVQARKAGRHIMIVDVRPAVQYRAGHVTDSINVPLPQLRTRFPKLQVSKKTELVAMCGTDACSAQAANTLKEFGYPKVSWCSMAKWEAARLPKEKFPPEKPAK